MRHPIKPALAAVALLAAMPAAAQWGAPDPAWRGGAPIPAPGGMSMPPPPMVSVNPPYIPGPPPMAQNGPGVPTAGARVWQNGRWMALPPRGRNQGGPRRGNRWGGTIEGRWYAGTQAPGGWHGWHRLRRGAHLPPYWMGNAFRIPDYLSWGLAAPPGGYFWVRYYNDAVLVDSGANVWDSVSGIGWDDGDTWSETDDGYRQPITPVDPNDYYGGYGGYPPAQGGYYDSYGGYGSSYQSGSWYYGAPVGSTVVITMPTTTTTTITEEVIEEARTTTYVRAAPRRVVRKAPVRRYKPRVQCCVCGCR